MLVNSNLFDFTFMKVEVPIFGQIKVLCGEIKLVSRWALTIQVDKAQIVYW